MQVKRSLKNSGMLSFSRLWMKVRELLMSYRSERNLAEESYHSAFHITCLQIHLALKSVGSQDQP